MRGWGVLVGSTTLDRRWNSSSRLALCTSSIVPVPVRQGFSASLCQAKPGEQSPNLPSQGVFTVPGCSPHPQRCYEAGTTQGKVFQAGLLPTPSPRPGWFPRPASVSYTSDRKPELPSQQTHLPPIPLPSATSPSSSPRSSAYLSPILPVTPRLLVQPVRLSTKTTCYNSFLGPRISDAVGSSGAHGPTLTSD